MRPRRVYLFTRTDSKSKCHVWSNQIGSRQTLTWRWEVWLSLSTSRPSIYGTKWENDSESCAVAQTSANKIFMSCVCPDPPSRIGALSKENSSLTAKCWATDALRSVVAGRLLAWSDTETPYAIHISPVSIGKVFLSCTHLRANWRLVRLARTVGYVALPTLQQ